MTIERYPCGNAPAISTARLALRSPTMDDAPVIACLADNWDIARRMSRLPNPYGLDDARFYLREIVPVEIAWAVTAAADGDLLGIAGLVPANGSEPFELGYWLGEPYWGRGFATEAAAAIVAYAFKGLGLSRIVSGCFVDNVGSRRVLEKIGFVDCGRSERSCLALGRDLPFVDMELERARYVALSNPASSDS